MELPKLMKTKPKSDKKKILLLSDDCRLKSGVGTMSREFIRGTCHIFDWVQLGGALNHPDNGKPATDISDSFRKMGTKTDDISIKVYPVAGYGDQKILRHLIDVEKPDAILHFTDPRFWGWLYAMESEIRQEMPLMYYNIWDDLPFPHWNESFYECCDLLMAISKQTYNINKHVCQRKPRTDWDLTYVPHGIDETIFKPVDGLEADYISFKDDMNLGGYDFIALFNSRNIRRKLPQDLMLGFRNFIEQLPKEEANKCVLLMHTDPVDPNGTDLPAVARNICPNVNIIFSQAKIDEKYLNYLYNMADVTCNQSSAEGFGLSHMESMMAGTPTIATVLGGLQDQMGFKVDGKEFSINHLTADVPTNSTGEISTEHGEWTLPLWPQLNMQGSPQTPYIYDSRPSVSQITNQLKVWYDMGREERKRRGMLGREWAIKNGFTMEGMSKAMIDSINGCFENWKPKDRFELINMSKYEYPKYPDGRILK